MRDAQMEVVVWAANDHSDKRNGKRLARNSESGLPAGCVYGVHKMPGVQVQVLPAPPSMLGLPNGSARRLGEAAHNRNGTYALNKGSLRFG